MPFFLMIYLENIQYRDELGDFGFGLNQEPCHLNSPQTFLKIYIASTLYVK
jgi:hypothetical protein